MPDFVRLDGRGVTLVVDVRGPAPFVLHWGARLPDDTDVATLSLLSARDEAPSSPAFAAPVALTPLAGQGFPGRPGLEAHRDGRDWATWTAIDSVETRPGEIVVVSSDAAHGVRLTHRLSLDPAGDVLTATTELANTGTAPLTVDACAAPLLPLPSPFTRLVTLEGRWAGEMQMRGVERAVGSVVRENRRGRTSHDAFPAVFATTPAAGEEAGEAYGFHLAWSGNHRIAVETLPDNRAFVAMGELFMPGELRLQPGETYVSPTIISAFSAEGLSGVSRAFHAHLRARPEHARLRSKARPIHYNTWEAVYFDHDPAVLHDLVERAAAIGAERFVLDDGWFKGRRADNAGLGDWTVDPAVHPAGLKPLIDRVQAVGMEFGLWVEPEMVNPDSDLFRAHPDWVLGTPPAPQLSFRNQLVLDFGRPAVRDHIHAAIDTLLREHAIAYLKWDMNRDVSHPGGADGRGGAHAHVLGLYAVLDRLRAEHPGVEIESCASGGGRMDFGILERTDRVWTSDSNDALDRLSIQRGASLLLPAEVMGAHVGPTDCHITGRILPMATRVQTAMFGHFGVEADLRALTPDETAQLAAGIALHKAHRDLIHTGDLFRLNRPHNEVAFGIVAADKAEAVFSFTLITEPSTVFLGRLRLAGLDANATYAVRAVWPRQTAKLGPALRDGFEASGAVLMQLGLELPRLKPASGFVLRLERR